MRNRQKSKITPGGIVARVAIVLFALVFCYSAFRLGQIFLERREQNVIADEMSGFRPELPDAPAPDTGSTGGTETDTGAAGSETDTGAAGTDSKPAAEVVNPSLEELQAINPDTVGWITIENTRLDYPFVQAGDNDYYLRRSIYGKKLVSGTVFMDYRCDPGFGDFCTIIYGHHMNNGSMFAAVAKYRSQDFFDTHTTGWIMTPRANYKFTVFAYLSVDYNGPQAYRTSFPNAAERVAHLEYITENALILRDIGVGADDRLIALSTCNNDTDNTRSLVFARLEELPR